MMRKRFFASFLLCLIISVSLSAFAYGAADKIKLTITTEADKGDWGKTEWSIYYYTVSKAGVEVISKTLLLDNQITVVELPKTNDTYTVTFQYETNESTYKMAIRKDFGDKIKYNTDTVYVYARMIEVTPEGEEIDRPDLSQNIDI